MKNIFKLIRIITVLVIFSFSSHAYAQTFTYTGWGKITSINMLVDGSITVYLDAAQINPASCTFSAYIVNKSSANFPEYYSFILASKGFNSEVRFRISNSICANGVDPNAAVPGNGYNPSIVFIETRDPS